MAEPFTPLLAAPPHFLPSTLLAAGQTAQGPAPMAILALCVLGAVGIGLLLPSGREATLRRVGGALLTVAGLILGVLLIRQAEKLQLMGETGVYFWAFAAIAIGAAVRVVTHPRPVYSALYFVLTVFASAGLFVLLWAQFMAAALVLIYAGAVLVTYVFVIMLAAESSSSSTESGATVGAEADRISRDPFLAGAVGFTLLGILLMVIFDRSAALPVPPPPPDPVRVGAFADSPAVTGDTQRLGAYLYQHQMIAIQVAMLILTLAMTGAVVISRRRIFVPASTTKAPIARPSEVTGPATPTDDDPHTIPIYGTDDPRAKQYPQT